VLALLARPLPEKLQRKALTYGLFGAVVFRLVALLLVTHLMAWNWVKFVGGAYLIFIAVKHLIFGEKEAEAGKPRTAGSGFWKVVLIIELTDIAFAVDSILAAVALSKKFWVVFTGGILGVVMMRFAATIFLKLLKKFPAFETTAYLLVFVIGTKVFLEALRIPSIDFHDSASPAFWIFWGIMAACFLYGFKRPRDREPSG
jgi:YkoY family integral membrane protein